MKDKTASLVTVAATGVLTLGLSLFCWLHPASDFSVSERRRLAQLPELSPKTLLSGKFMSEFETYTLDQFPLRDTFRTIKALNHFYVFQQKDNNGVYLVDGSAAKLEYPLKQDSVKEAGEKLQAIYDRYLAGTDTNVYLSVIPDKNYFLAAQNGYPTMDYDKLLEIIRENTPFATYIDITGALRIDDYYTTDAHWRQERILDVAQIIADAMGSGGPEADSYTYVTADAPFYGVYYGQSALPLPGETLNYLTSPTLDGCTVYNYETDKTTGVYDLAKLTGKDPYEVFLSGAAALLRIDNPAAKTNRELVVFRDSFGSSLTPLLLENYSKVTLVDTRYIASDLLGSFLTFDKQDVLFLYSTQVLNNSNMLK